jgi:WD40 repeat protein
VVSASCGLTIDVWDAQSGDRVAGPFKGHMDRVRSVVFSLDGTRIFSGSVDRTIRIWDVQYKPPLAVESLADWTMSDDGWIVGHDSQLLLWVPSDMRAGLKRPQNMAVFYDRGVFELQFNGVLLGSRWQDCQCP